MTSELSYESFHRVAESGGARRVVGDDYMPSKLKRRVRARMEKTGESWQTAERQVRAASVPDLISDGACQNVGGNDEFTGDSGDEFEERVLTSTSSDLAEDVRRPPIGVDDSSKVSFDLPKPTTSAAGPSPMPLTTLPELLEALALSAQELRAFTTTGTNCYRQFTIAKRDGSRRSIKTPEPRLMAVQRRILHLIVERLPAHDASHGFRIGRSSATNAAVHVNSMAVVNLDIQDFSSAITLPRVLGVFRHAGYPEPIARVLALLCTASDSGVRRLPQGAPTTPGLSNAVCFKLDRRLAGLASRYGWRYTRYGDDLTFSIPAGKAEPTVARLLGAIERIVAIEGFLLHPEKTHVARSSNSQRVTGLVVNGPGVPRLPREIRRRQRAEAHNLLHRPDTVDKPQ